ncbi:hypothetical protein V1477_004546 [Vespula maculifrons]|uniref:Uncharacterized protein n=1 Tax=Vespula maculifrons TaxID=7453 RepID=A0ABD2CME1_VESMC
MASSFGCFLSLEEALADVFGSFFSRYANEMEMTFSTIDWKSPIRSSFIAIEHEEVPAGLNSSFALA